MDNNSDYLVSYGGKLVDWRDYECPMDGGWCEDKPHSDCDKCRSEFLKWCENCNKKIKGDF